MSFSNSLTYNNQLNASMMLPPGLFAPLSIEPVTNIEPNIWSPFSCPSLSPYSCSQAYFQYSNSHNSSKNHQSVHYQIPIGTKNSAHLVNLNSPSSLSNYYETSFQRQLISQNSYQNQSNGIDSKPDKLPKRSDQVDMSDYIRQAMIQKAMGGRSKVCTFCKTNGEPEIIYTSHSLKDASDRITCPILQRYVCPDCGATGEKTHTKKYCPVLQKKLRMEMLKKLISQRSVRN